jgi:hypothetical protein
MLVVGSMSISILWCNIEVIVTIFMVLPLGQFTRNA